METKQLYVNGNPFCPQSAYDVDDAEKKIMHLQEDNQYRYSLDKAIFCFIDDDGNSAFNDLYQRILQPRGIVGGMSICTGFMGMDGWLSADEIKIYQANGWSILNHSCDGETLTQENAGINIAYALKQFADYGIVPERVFVYPNGNIADDKTQVENIVKQYADYAINISTDGTISNQIPFTEGRMDIKRIFADESIDEDNMDWIKTEIDSVIENKGLFIVSTHSFSYRENLLIEVLDYILTKGYSFTTPKDAFQMIREPRAEAYTVRAVDIYNLTGGEKTTAQALINAIAEKVVNQLLEKTEIADWAKEASKPVYSAKEVGADVEGSAQSALTAAKEYSDDTYTQATGYTDLRIAELINGAPETLDTLKEVADAMAENETVVEALNAAMGTKAAETEFQAHVANETIHITASERENLNNMQTDIEELNTALGQLCVLKTCSTNAQLKKGASTTVTSTVTTPDGYKEVAKWAACLNGHFVIVPLMGTNDRKFKVYNIDAGDSTTATGDAIMLYHLFVKK